MPEQANARTWLVRTYTRVEDSRRLHTIFGGPSNGVRYGSRFCFTTSWKKVLIAHRSVLLRWRPLNAISGRFTAVVFSVSRRSLEEHRRRRRSVARPHHR